MKMYTPQDVPQDLTQRSFAAKIARIMPAGGAPLFAISGMAQKVEAKQIEHGYWMKTMIYPSAVTDGGTQSDSATELNVVSTAELVEGDVLRYQKAYSGTQGVWATYPEVMVVLSVLSPTKIRVLRGHGGSPVAAIPDDTRLIQVGTIHEVGSNAPRSRAVTPERRLNNTQIFRDAWDVTGTLAATQLENNYNSVAENRADCAAFHSQSIEKAAFFGVMGSATINGRWAGSMDGIESLVRKYAPSNLYEAGSTTTLTQLETMLNPLLDYVTDTMHGNARTIFVGSQALSVINNIGRLSGQYQLQHGMTEFGLQFNRFRTSRGHFNLIEHPLFNTNDDWKKMAVVVDLSSFDFAYLQGRDTFHTDISTKTNSPNGKDALAGVLTTELTIQLTNPFASGIIYNLRGAAAA